MTRDELTAANLARGRSETRGPLDERLVDGDDRSVGGSEHPLDAPPPGGPAPAASGSRSPEVAAHDRGSNAVTCDAPVGPPEPIAEVRETRQERGSTPSIGHVPLFPGDQAARFRSRWADVQAAFGDEPRSAVERADALVADVMRQLAEGFANERAALERGWDRGDNVTSGDLRGALQRYQSFFERLLKN